MRKIEGILYCIHCYNSNMFVEAPREGAFNELARYCAELSADGHVITSVTELYQNSRETPRVKVLSSPEYKHALKAVLAARKNRKLYRISADDGNTWTEQWLTEKEAKEETDAGRLCQPRI